MAALIARDEAVASRIGEYSFEGGGKRLRPLIFCLTNEALGRGLDNQTLETSTAFEFLHMATLLHDDIVDDARLRRGRQAAHLVFGAPETVLAGDYLLAKSALLGAETYNLACVKILASIVRAMSLGELTQLAMRHNTALTEAEYFDIIYRKTAALIEGAAHSAAELAKAAPGQIQAARVFGKKLGLAFQIMDDVLDYQTSEENFGKPVGHDLVEGKITLPFILAREALDERDRETLCQLAGEPFDPTDWPQVRTLVEKGRGVEQALSAAKTLAAEAAAALAPFPPTAAREQLTALAAFVVARDR